MDKATKLFNRLLDENNLELTLAPARILRVEDGSFLMTAATVTVHFKDTQTKKTKEEVLQ